MAKDVIIACDFPSMEATLEFLDRFGDTKPYVKIGMELFYAAGPEIIKEIKKRGHKIFLDLKLCDIPNTVKSAMSVLSQLDVDMTNLHAFGGHKMMEAAIEGLTRPDGTRPILIAVTMLTSTSKELMNEDLLIPGEVDSVVASYAKNAQMSGLDGVVCSPREASIVKITCGDKFVTVTPGIRFADSATDDQVRVMTPAKAREIGSDYIVVGRPITKAEDPLAAYQRCCEEFLGK
ncbi:MAG: orotidine-5'-phosphate decarboxylase [Muribaculaceae bacterium]|nr:orotidine-5'-phosphate decarboxylase [Muribaculaceae bacterium]